MNALYDDFVDGGRGSFHNWASNNLYGLSLWSRLADTSLELFAAKSAYVYVNDSRSFGVAGSLLMSLMMTGAVVGSPELIEETRDFVPNANSALEFLKLPLLGGFYATYDFTV